MDAIRKHLSGFGLTAAVAIPLVPSGTQTSSAVAPVVGLVLHPSVDGQRYELFLGREAKYNWHLASFSEPLRSVRPMLKNNMNGQAALPGCIHRSPSRQGSESKPRAAS